MKIDPMQTAARTDGKYSGDISPTRFTFTSDRLIYPLRITQISVPEETDALLYVEAPAKMDLFGRWSYQRSWAPMWEQAFALIYPQRVTPQERAWEPVVSAALPQLRQQLEAERRRDVRWQPTRLEWARKLNRLDMAMLDGAVLFDRQVEPATVPQLRILRGHLQEGQWLTKRRKVFRRDEMTQDLEFTPATLGGQADGMEYTYSMPSSPP
jgi:hypothetical protein